ncbi:MAG TPA: MogA/MoaB family molybdenum cofactor biosynthesis protein [Chloroflexota bacterium]|nr:MogA/MoaB family molybdenum cofactor biosynthesis protein [Chloroflexota bacterium]
MRIGILTVSDRASAGVMEDRGGPAIRESLDPSWEVARAEIVPDDAASIAERLRQWTDTQAVDVILTTGGTGLGPRDVTPEAVLSVADRPVPGIAEALRAAGLEQTPQAMLSRGVAAIRGHTLIVTLPGSPRGAAQGVELLRPVLPHAIATMQGSSHAGANTTSQ